MARKDLIKYIRTDKNGTEIYHDYTCPRCSGYGELDKWAYTGRICFACGGSGISPTPKVIKQYTPEYAAKLEAKRIARERKHEEERRKYAEEHKEEIEAENRRILETRYAENGCGKDGIGYILKGNTYPVKDQIKKNGGKWIYGVWICPVEIKGEGIRSKQINLTGHIGSGSMVWLDDYELSDETIF